MKNKKGLPAKAGIIHLLPLILIAGVVVAAIGGLFYFNQGSDQPLIVKTETDEELGTSEFETSDLDSSDWQIYINEEYGFRFYYPPNYKLVNQNSNTSFYLESDLNSPYDEKSKQNIFFEFRKDLNYKEVFNQRTSVLDSVEKVNLTSGTYITGYGTRESEGMKFNIAIFQVQGLPAIFTTFFEDDEIIKDFRDIISTFEFIENERISISEDKNEVSNFFLNCEVKGVVKTPTEEVVIFFKNGDIVRARASDELYVDKLIDESIEKCGNISINTAIE